jgi:predicted ArsR family transcriptional regulator
MSVDVPVNKRQQWFLEQLQLGVPCKAKDIAAKWSVVEKTVKRDISDLRQKECIVFVGSPKTDTYQLKTVCK